ncbi:gamma-tubulin complex component 3-like [Gordionus sp. m RMFG-2023]|uniref:gamma-tubulin complex component 3-like n=1 Tax=Gordionus sp. m RMFG-2023 TaxID=3053472 RepID=UPI0031FBC06B
MNYVNFGKYLNFNAKDESSYLLLKKLQIHPKPYSTHELLLPFENNLTGKSSEGYTDEKGCSDSFLVLHFVESLLLKDLMYVMIDIDGQHIKIRGKPLEWNIEIVDNPDTKHGNTFFLLHPATLEQVKKIAECGWLYFKIQNFINENNVLEKGLILQVLSSSLKDELIHYYKLISVIKEAVDKDSQKFLTDSTKERNKEIATDLPQNSTITDPLITVQRLWVMCTDMKHRLQFLMAIIMNCKGKKGCQILDVLKEFTFQGDIKGTGATANSLLDKCSQPLAECLCNWITKGKLVDRFREPLGDIAHTTQSLKMSVVLYENIIPNSISCRNF